MSATIQLRRGTAATWTSVNPTLHAGEPGYETDTGRVKIGDGATAWTSLSYAAPGQPLGLTGATAATRYVGGTASGAPASGTFAKGDYVIGQDGSVWICTAAGTPGTWTQVSGGGGGGTTGAPLLVLPVGGLTNDSGSNWNGGGNNIQQWASPVVITGTMYVRSIMLRVSTSGSGSVSWGLFDYSSNPASAAQLCGGSGAVGGTGWQAIAATSAPVTVSAGNYLLVFGLPAANAPFIFYGKPSGDVGVKSTKTRVTAWSTTPDFTTGWSADATFHVALLGGFSSTTPW